MKSSPDVFLPMPDPSVYNSKLSLHGSEKTPPEIAYSGPLKIISYEVSWRFSSKVICSKLVQFSWCTCIFLVQELFLVQGHSVACGARAIGGRGVKKINFRHHLKKVRPSAVWKVKKGTIISAQRFKYSNRTLTLLMARLIIVVEAVFMVQQSNFDNIRGISE